jgi:hypothetical protein
VCLSSTVTCATVAASEDRHMLIAFTGFCFVLLPGQVLEVGDRASNPGRACVILFGSTVTGVGGCGSLTFIHWVLTNLFKGEENGQNHEVQRATEKCSRKRHCQLVSLYFVDGI